MAGTITAEREKNSLNGAEIRRNYFFRAHPMECYCGHSVRITNCIPPALRMHGLLAILVKNSAEKMRGKNQKTFSDCADLFRAAPKRSAEKVPPYKGGLFPRPRGLEFGGKSRAADFFRAEAGAHA